MNAVAAQLVNSELLYIQEIIETSSSVAASGEADGAPSEVYQADLNFLAQEWTFGPEKGNVVFSSALDSWVNNNCHQFVCILVEILL